MDDHSLQLRVIYEDLTDLIELGVRVIHGEWSAVVTASYTSPSFFIDSGEGFLRWVETLSAAKIKLSRKGRNE
jgi:hypothetical protein